MAGGIKYTTLHIILLSYCRTSGGHYDKIN